MLVLSRKTDQKIVILPIGIEITVCSTDNKRASIGIKAPDDQLVFRSEILDKKRSDGDERLEDR